MSHQVNKATQGGSSSQQAARNPQTASSTKQAARNPQTASSTQQASRNPQTAQSGSHSQQAARNPRATQSGSSAQQQVVRDLRDPQTRRSQEKNSARNLQAHIDRFLGQQRAAEGLLTPKRRVRFRFTSELWLLPAQAQFSTEGMDRLSFVNRLIEDYNNQRQDTDTRIRISHQLPQTSKVWCILKPAPGYLLHNSVVVYTFQSPIFDLTAHPFWRDDVEAVYKYFGPLIEFSEEVVDDRGTIDIFPESRYCLTEVKRLFQAGVHFADTLGRMVGAIPGFPDQLPGNWRENLLVHGSEREVLERVESMQWARELLNLWPDRQWPYDFWHLLVGVSRGFWRYVRVPVLATARQAIQHSTLAVAFIEAVIAFADHPLEELLKYTPDTKGLGQFLSGQVPH